MGIAVDLRSLMETGGKISGVENYLGNILSVLPNEDQRYFGFYNSFKKRNLPKFKDLVVKSTRIPNKIFNLSLTLFGLPKFESLYGDFDVLWMPDIRPFAVKKNTKLAVTVHDMSPLMHPKFYSIKRRIWHRVVQYRKTFNRADIIFAVSEYTKYDLIKLFGIPESKIKVIHSGIDQHRFNTNLDQRLKHKVRDRYNLPEKFILSICTVEPRKNISNLVSAFERIQDSDTHLVIAGRLGWLYKDLLAQVNSSPKLEKIHLIDYVQEEDKPYLISLSEIVCYPSYYEGFGFVPLEAMACGVAVITSARTSMPEVCQDAALLVEPLSLTDLVSGIDSLMGDAKLRESFVAKGLERAKLFDWHKTVTEINRHLTELQ